MIYAIRRRALSFMCFSFRHFQIYGAGDNIHFYQQQEELTALVLKRSICAAFFSFFFLFFLFQPWAGLSSALLPISIFAMSSRAAVLTIGKSIKEGSACFSREDFNLNFIGAYKVGREKKNSLCYCGAWRRRKVPQSLVMTFLMRCE